MVVLARRNESQSEVAFRRLPSGPICRVIGSSAHDGLAPGHKAEALNRSPQGAGYIHHARVKDICLGRPLRACLKCKRPRRWWQRSDGTRKPPVLPLRWLLARREGVGISPPRNIYVEVRAGHIPPSCGMAQRRRDNRAILELSEPAARRIALRCRRNSVGN
jgi:hypothetical protein